MSGPPPILAFVGRSGVGKTTLLAGVVAALTAQGLRIGVIKHSRRFDDPDRAGKDSQRLRAAGAARLVLASPEATVLFCRHGAEPSFAERLALAAPDSALVLVESYRSADLPYVEVLRRGYSEQLGFAARTPVAVAADFRPQGLAVPWLPLDDPPAVAEFVRRWAGFGEPPEHGRNFSAPGGTSPQP